MYTKKQTKITDFYKSKKINKKLINNTNSVIELNKVFGYNSVTELNKVFGYNSVTESWHCLECGDDLGKHNPRQLCGKSYCRNKY